ncbi:MAG TPA: phosphatase PAP2 family protein [Thermomicrobiales bacterium]|nr:phosphatase PAP2 family protein [Thermomicrobiales bacterium]
MSDESSPWTRSGRRLSARAAGWAGDRRHRDAALGPGVIALLMAGFIILTWAVLLGWTQTFDTAVTDAIHGLNDAGLTAVMHRATPLLKLAVAATLVLAGALALRRRGRAALLVLASVLGAAAFNDALKIALRRNPPGPLPAQPVCWSCNPVDLFERVSNAYSFPSGHTVMAVVTLGLLAYLLGGWLPRRGRPLVAVGAALLVALLAVSRVYLGTYHPPHSANFDPQHVPTDVLGGALLGGAWLVGTILLLRLTKGPEMRAAEARRAAAPKRGDSCRSNQLNQFEL